MEKWEKVNAKNNYKTSKQTKKNTNIKRKQTCSVGFVKTFKFQENKFKIVQKKFVGKNNDKKNSLEKSTVTMIIAW